MLRSLSYLPLTVAFICVGCGNSGSASDKIVGVWQVEDASTSGNACDVTPPKTEYFADGQSVTTSGAQRLIETYKLEPEGNGYVLSYHPVSHNGELSCAGNPPEFAMDRSNRETYIEIDGNRMTAFLDGPGSTSMNLIRVL